MPTGGNGADDDALADVVLGLEAVAERLDDPNRLMTEYEAVSHGILAPHDVHVGSADRRRRDPDDGLP
jgi:hypothetical protein